MKGMVVNMKLEEFINHLKHKSLTLTLCYEDGKHIYSTTVGEYTHWIHKNDYSDMIIDMITTSADGFTIYLEGE